MKPLSIIIGCESSGVVRRAFRERGHDAWSCDLLPSDDDSPFHIQGDVMDVMNEGWDVGIFHPTCTYLCNSGVRWLFGGKGQEIDNERWAKMVEGAEFFKRLWNAPIPRVAVENPIMHRYAREIIGIASSQIIQPFEYGHGESKATCLWLKGLPLLRPTHVDAPLFGAVAVTGREQRIYKLPPSPDRWKLRSRTFEGIAQAMAEQWG